MKFLSLTLATTCLLGMVAGCGGDAAGPDAVREPPPLFLGPAPRPLALINGHVVDFDTGQKLAGAKVDAVDESNAPLSSLTTDAAGEFRMELARAGLVRFRVSAAGYPSYDRNHFLEGNEDAGDSNEEGACVTAVRPWRLHATSESATNGDA